MKKIINKNNKHGFVRTGMITLLLLCPVLLFSQSIRFERTDVEGKNANFITATYEFGIDIYIDDIDHCSNVAFELFHNQVEHIQLSHFEKSTDWLIEDN